MLSTMKEDVLFVLSCHQSDSGRVLVDQFWTGAVLTGAEFWWTSSDRGRVLMDQFWQGQSSDGPVLTGAEFWWTSSDRGRVLMDQFWQGQSSDGPVLTGAEFWWTSSDRGRVLMDQFWQGQSSDGPVLTGAEFWWTSSDRGRVLMDQFWQGQSSDGPVLTEAEFWWTSSELGKLVVVAQAAVEMLRYWEGAGGVRVHFPHSIYLYLPWREARDVWCFPSPRLKSQGTFPTAFTFTCPEGRPGMSGVFLPHVWNLRALSPQHLPLPAPKGGQGCLVFSLPVSEISGHFPHSIYLYLPRREARDVWCFPSPCLKSQGTFPTAFTFTCPEGRPGMSGVFPPHVWNIRALSPQHLPLPAPKGGQGCLVFSLPVSEISGHFPHSIYLYLPRREARDVWCFPSPCLKSRGTFPTAFTFTCPKGMSDAPPPFEISRHFPHCIYLYLP